MQHDFVNQYKGNCIHYWMSIMNKKSVSNKRLLTYYINHILFN